MLDREERAKLRALLSLLIARQENAQLLYIPHGEAGQRRMIAALLEIDPQAAQDEACRALVSWFFSLPGSATEGSS